MEPLGALSARLQHLDSHGQTLVELTDPRPQGALLSVQTAPLLASVTERR